jgi:hypothetical protein
VGDGVPKDRDEADKWYAAAKKDRSPDEDLAFRWGGWMDGGED